VALIATAVLIALFYPRTTHSDIEEAPPILNPLESLSETPTTEEVKLAVSYIANEYGIDEVCYHAIVRCESQYRNVCNFNYGCSGGIGYAQIIKQTAQHCSKKMGREIDPHNPIDNLECGAWLLKNEGTYHWGTKDTWWGSWKCWHTSC
jgi:soluble lytic murein transglycosylase-like protein